MVLSIKQDSSFEEKCRKEGGVPVQTFSSTNCAAEGYIDINLK